ncbi:hypothetical protein GY45DRAFT_1327660 [Cubamyces sp. BRFM 1775]|nr:hypothetical protein GY45DRAFT_1327660 [Cubamyces sp. BRFM 1775]
MLYYFEYYYGFAPTYEQCKRYYNARKLKPKPSRELSGPGNIDNLNNFLDHQGLFVKLIVDDILTRVPTEWRLGDSTLYLTSVIGNRSDELAPWWPIIAFACLKPGRTEREVVQQQLEMLKGQVWVKFVKFVQDLLESEAELSWHTDAMLAPVYRHITGKVREAVWASSDAH